MTIISIRINFEIPSYTHPARYSMDPPRRRKAIIRIRIGFRRNHQPHGDAVMVMGSAVATSLVAVVFESNESVVAAVIVVASADAVVACGVSSLCSP